MFVLHTSWLFTSECASIIAVTVVYWSSPFTCALDVGLYLIQVTLYFHPLILYSHRFHLKFYHACIHFVWSDTHACIQFIWSVTHYCILIMSPLHLCTPFLSFPSFLGHFLSTQSVRGRFTIFRVINSCIFELLSGSFWGIKVGFKMSSPSCMFSLGLTFSGSANAWAPFITLFCIGREGQVHKLIIWPVDKLQNKTTFLIYQLALLQ